MITLKRTSSEDQDFQYLIQLLDKELLERYPATQHALKPFNQVKLDAKVVLAYVEDKLAGCGCYRNTQNDGEIEIKRMFVKESYRGKGIARNILFELEQWAKENGKINVILETGIKQPEAIALYKKCNYVEIEKYAPYVNSKESVCMGKAL